MNPEKFGREDKENMRVQTDTMEVMKLSARIREISEEAARLNAVATNQDLPDTQRDEAQQNVMELGAQIEALSKRRAQTQARLIADS